MTEATVQQPATTTREQIWLNREQVRKEKPVYRALKRVQDVFFSLLALIVLSPLLFLEQLQSMGRYKLVKVVLLIRQVAVLILTVLTEL